MTTGGFQVENGGHPIHRFGAADGSAANKRGKVVIASALMVLGLSAGAGAVLAHERGEESEQTVIKSREFTIPKGQCSQLPADLEVKGLGLERTRTVVESANEDGRREGHEGRITYSMSSRITGTATDSRGGTYTFSYQLRLTKPIPIPGSGIVTDTFTLTGTGAADGMSTFFRVKVTFDSGANAVGFELLEQAGDPFHCDPL